MARMQDVLDQNEAIVGALRLEEDPDRVAAWLDVMEERVEVCERLMTLERKACERWGSDWWVVGRSDPE